MATETIYPVPTEWAARAKIDRDFPVKLIHTRETQFATSFPRTPTYHKLKAGIKDGELLAMNHDIVCGWMGPRFSVGKKYGTDWLGGYWPGG